MDNVEACMILDGSIEADEGQIVEALALLIRNGLVWSLQGSYGRMAARAIEAGMISREGDVLVYPWEDE